jgi:aminopeptidase N
MYTTIKAFALALLTVVACGCSSYDPADDKTPNKKADAGARISGASSTELPMDVHSQSRPNEVRVTHARLDLTLDFKNKTIHGTVALDLDRLKKDAPLVLDTDSLSIDAVTGADGKPRKFELGKKDALLGQALTIELADGDKSVTVKYATSPNASALQWLTKEQTFSQKGEYLYTQGQAILTRSWIPLQDTPGVRMTYAATIRGPKEMRVVMSANSRKDDGDGVYSFAMEKPIPSYLFALACGHIEFAKISERCGVFADPLFLKKSVAEFADTEKMLQKCEEKYGAYEWGRYDILVLPPAFPFGGMENPTLTFATPTIVTGDKSLVALVAHEMAHSWSGNLVTNATWRDFWLNEGFTVYLEQRIMELVYGEERAILEISTSLSGLEKEVLELPPKDQILHIDLTGRNPDDAMTAIAYDKGAAFLRRLEEVFGRDTFDAFLQGYFKAHAFKSITTEMFLDYLDEHLLKKNPTAAKLVDVNTWVFKPGLPKTMAKVKSGSFVTVDEVREIFMDIHRFPPASPHAKWSYHEWLYFLEGLPDSTDDSPVGLTEDYFESLESAGFASRFNPNPEIRCAFLTLAMKHKHYRYAGDAMEFLANMGRRKFILPIFKQMVKTQQGKQLAEELYGAIETRVHSITLNSLKKIMGKK